MVAINRDTTGLPPSSSRGGGCSFIRVLLVSIGCIVFTIIVIMQRRDIPNVQMELSVRFKNNNDADDPRDSETTTSSSSATTLLPHEHSELFPREQQEQCRFFLAESAIPKAGLGIFTAIDIEKGEPSQSMPDICIYVADTPSGTDFNTHSWSRRVFRASFEGEYPRGACEGVATLVNSMPEDVRTSYLVPLDIQTNGGLTRAKDPGAGAITQYYGIRSKALKHIGAGSEITIDYGDWKYKSGVEYKAKSRSVEWLRTFGMCIDHIEIKQATNPAMGRGAFARRALAAGSLVAPAPLQTFPDRSKFAQQTPEALFVNYCFQPKGAKTNGMMLYPYGPGVNLINHSSEDPNVEVRWSKHHTNHAQWLTLPVEQFWEMIYPGGLILDYVATRDIAEGEELFMDYGPEWERAWIAHAVNWKPPEGIEDYVYPADMDLTGPFRTVEEQKRNPYPPNLATVCPTMNKKHYREEYSRLEWKRPTGHWPTEGMAYCTILKRELNESTNEYEYEVSLNWDKMEPHKEDKGMYIDYGVPHAEIYFADKPYTSDLHLPNAFRHPIGLPDHLVPEQWKQS